MTTEAKQVNSAKNIAFDKIKSLVNRFDEQKEFYKKADYNETQTRRDFIDPFWKHLGWDVDNENGYAENYREVIHEDKIKIDISDINDTKIKKLTHTKSDNSVSFIDNFIECQDYKYSFGIILLSIKDYHSHIWLNQRKNIQNKQKEKQEFMNFIKNKMKKNINEVDLDQVRAELFKVLKDPSTKIK